MDEERQIITNEPWVSTPKRTLQSSINKVVAGTSAILLRSIGRIVSLRPSERRTTDALFKARRRPPLPNGYLASFIAIVVVPSFLSMVYFAFIASNQYIAEARFAVHRAQFDFRSDEGKSRGMPFVGGLPVVANDDAYMISDYIGSRAIVDDLSKTINVRAIFQRPEADSWTRLKKNASAEELTKYWRKMVGAFVERTSGIVILTVRTFRPADSQTLAKAILAESEKLANDVSLRARKAIMKDAEHEVRRSEANVRIALLNLRRFRDKQGYIDPATAAASTSTLLMQAMAQRISLENQYYVSAKATSASAPSVVELKSQLNTLDRQIEQLKSKLTSTSPQGRSIAASLGNFEELELKRVFAEKLYTMAQDSLERARLRAEQQNIYVSTFVSPSLPQESEYPHRFSFSILIMAGLTVIWAILAMLAASIEDHRS